LRYIADNLLCPWLAIQTAKVNRGKGAGAKQLFLPELLSRFSNLSLRWATWIKSSAFSAALSALIVVGVCVGIPTMGYQNPY